MLGPSRQQRQRQQQQQQQRQRQRRGPRHQQPQQRHQSQQRHQQQQQQGLNNNENDNSNHKKDNDNKIHCIRQSVRFNKSGKMHSVRTSSRLRGKKGACQPHDSSLSPLSRRIPSRHPMVPHLRMMSQKYNICKRIKHEIKTLDKLKKALIKLQKQKGCFQFILQ